MGNESNDAMTPQRCFACGRRLVRPRPVYLTDRLADGGSYVVQVGPECFGLARQAGAAGFQPPRGGPRIYVTDPNREAC